MNTLMSGCPDIYGKIESHGRNRQRVEDDKKITEHNRKLIIGYCDHQKRQQLSIHTTDKVLCTLARIGKLTQKPFDQLKREDCEKIVDSIMDSQDIGVKWKADTLKNLKTFLKWVKKTDGDYPKEIKWLTVKNVKASPVNPKDFLTVEDVKNMSEGETNLRNKAFLLTLWESGMRVGSLATLRIGDIQVDEEGTGAFIVMREGVASKTGHWKVPMFYFWSSLNQWLLSHPRKDDRDAYVFCDLSHKVGEPISYSSLKKIWRNALKRVKLTGKKTNIHSVRHSSISHFAQSGLLTQQELCMKYWGQPHSAQLNRYVHIDMDAMMGKLKGKRKQVENARPKTCIFCGVTNDALTNRCVGCGKSLTPGDEIEEQRRQYKLAVEFNNYLKANNPVLLKELNKQAQGG